MKEDVTGNERQYGNKNQYGQIRLGRMDCRSVHQGTGPAGGNDHERAKLEGTFQEQTGTGGLVQGQPAYYKKRIPEVNSYFARMYNLK